MSDYRYNPRTEQGERLPKIAEVRDRTKFTLIKKNGDKDFYEAVQGKWVKTGTSDFLDSKSDQTIEGGKTFTGITNFDAEVLFNYNPYTDLRMPATAINPPGIASDPSYDATNMGWSFQVNDELQIITQMPHEWKEASTIYPHVHFKQTDANNVGWEIDYRIYNNNTDISALGFTNLALDQQSFTYSSGTLAQINSSSNGIAMTGKTISCIIEIKLKRVTDSAPTDVVLTEFDIHYQIDSLGSVEEYTK